MLHCHWCGDWSGIMHSELRQDRPDVALLMDVNRVMFPNCIWCSCWDWRRPSWDHAFGTSSSSDPWSAQSSPHWQWSGDHCHTEWQRQRLCRVPPCHGARTVLRRGVIPRIHSISSSPYTCYTTRAKRASAHEETFQSGVQSSTKTSILDCCIGSQFGPNETVPAAGAHISLLSSQLPSKPCMRPCDGSRDQTWRRSRVPA